MLKLFLCQICLIFLWRESQAVTYTNPVVAANTPDPGVLYYNGTYYSVTTGWDSTNAYPIRKSTDLVNWTQIGYIFPDYKNNKNPSWASTDFWAPELHLITDSSDPSQRRFNAYYSIRHTNGILSVGVATSNNPEGPYKDIGKPLYQNSSDGSIDASFFRDHNTQTPYLIYKVDGNADGHPTPIFAVQTAADGLSLVGSPTKLIQEDQAWEGNLVEGPWIFYHNTLQYYYLFFSGNGFSSANYAVGVARSKNALGPYTKLSSNPILHTASSSSNPKWAGPGHCSVIGVKNGQIDVEIVYHAWASNAIGTGSREMLVDTVNFDSTSGWPNINNGSNVPSQTARTIPT